MIGKELRKARVIRDLTQQQVGGMIGTTRQEICKIEGGDISLSLARFFYLLKKLGVSDEEIVGVVRAGMADLPQ